MKRIAILIGALAALMLIPAAQAFAEGLKVNIAGEGRVEQITLYGETSPEPIDCPGVCEGTIAPAEFAALGAYADEGSEFTGWTITKGGAYFLCDGSEEEKEFAEGFYIISEEPKYEGMDGACFIDEVGGEAEVTATFSSAGPANPTPLTLNVEEGEGTVQSSPAGIESCSASGGTCNAEFEENEEVTLTASPAPGYLFKSWKKCDPGKVNGRQCTVKMSEAKEVGAKFVKVWSLEGSKSGGLGILNTSPGGVNCGYACNSSSALYKDGFTVTVKQKAAKHFHFVEYTGGTGSAAVCNGHNAAEGCSFPIEEDSSIEEVYAPDAQNTLSLSKEGGGQGFVKTKPTNINCGYTCTAAEAEFYASETEVTVSVKLNKGTNSVTWVSGSGTCTGTVETTESTCTVDMSSSHELVAKFE